MVQKTRTASSNKKVIDGMKHLILCEGKDAWNFIVSYLNSNALAYNPAFSNIIQVEDFHGNDELPIQLQLWKNSPGFENLKTLTVIRDAERDSKQACRQVLHAFEKALLPTPSMPCQIEEASSLATCFMLFPTCSENVQDGTLEDLCLSILSESEGQTLSEIDAFLNHLKTEKLRSFPHEFKTKLHTYFSITDNYVSLKIGEAAKAGAFNWESPKLKPLKNKLNEIISI